VEIHPHHGAMPEIHPTAWVAPGAHIIGDVHIGEGAGVWFGSVLRGDMCSISIGRFTNVQDNTVIHIESEERDHPCRPCIVGDYVTIGHACIIHGCTIDDRVLVGMGSVLMNWSHIASDTILGARALVSERKEIPSRSLVLGIPGKIVRELSDEEVGHIMHSADTYRALAQSYRNPGTPFTVPGLEPRR